MDHSRDWQIRRLAQSDHGELQETMVLWSIECRLGLQHVSSVSPVAC